MGIRVVNLQRVPPAQRSPRVNQESVQNMTSAGTTQVTMAQKKVLRRTNHIVFV